MADEKSIIPVDLAQVDSSQSPTDERRRKEEEKQLETATYEPIDRRTDSMASTAHGDSSDTEAQARSSEVEIKCPPPVKVPRSERRGFLSQICFIAEVENPRHYSRRMKWLLTAVVAAAAIAAPVGSGIILPSLADIGYELHSTPTVTNLCIALYMLGLAIFPVWWSFFSETFGRRTVYVVSFALFSLWNILTAISPNIAMLIVMRVLAGGASGSVQAVGAGTVSDIWEPRERGKAMGIFFLGPLMGPLLSPIIGGALEERWQWRATAWFMVIYGGVTLLAIVFLLPETLHKRRNAVAEASNQVEADASSATANGAPLSRISTRQSVAKSTKKTARFLRMAFIDPFKIIKYLQFPPVILCVLYASVTFASLYVLQISIQSTFGAAPYNFTPIEVGCAYLFNSVGYLCASYLGGRWSDHIMIREARRKNRYDEKGTLILHPQDRMRENAYIAAVLYPLALLWYGWTAHYLVTWPVVLLANFFFGVGCMIMFGLITTMLTEFMPNKSSAGIALNNLIRNIVACIGIFVCQPLINAIGNGWLFTGVTVISLSSGSVIFLIRRYGKKWRDEMEEKLRQEESKLAR